LQIILLVLVAINGLPKLVRLLGLQMWWLQLVVLSQQLLLPAGLENQVSPVTLFYCCEVSFSAIVFLAVFFYPLFPVVVLD
jgi:hypothetical protein